MNNTFKRSFAAFAAVFALAGVARAEEIHIDLTGKDARTIHAEIVKAAYQVCQSTGADSIALSSKDDCVSPTIDKADADARRVMASIRMEKAELAPDLRGQR